MLPTAVVPAPSHQVPCLGLGVIERTRDIVRAAVVVALGRRMEARSPVGKPALHLFCWTAAGCWAWGGAWGRAWGGAWARERAAVGAVEGERVDSIRATAYLA